MHVAIYVNARSRDQVRPYLYTYLTHSTLTFFCHVPYFEFIKTRGATVPARTTCCLQLQVRTRQHVKTMQTMSKQCRKYEYIQFHTGTGTPTQTNCAYIHFLFFSLKILFIPIVHCRYHITTDKKQQTLHTH